MLVPYPFGSLKFLRILNSGPTGGKVDVIYCDHKSFIKVYSKLSIFHRGSQIVQKQKSISIRLEAK